MTRIVTLIACALTVTALFVIAPGPAERSRADRLSAYKSKKGKIDKKKAHRLMISPGVPLYVYLHTTNLSASDKIETDDVKASFPGYTLDCDYAETVDVTAGSQTLLKLRFKVTRNAKDPEQVKKKHEDYGTGDLTITLNTEADGMTTSAPIPAVGD